MPFLEVRNLSVNYDGIAAVKNASLFVEEREVVVIIGANGAGKSSLLRALAGLTPSTSTQMTLDGTDMRSLTVRDRVRMGLALVPETRELFPAMTVEDNLKLGLYLHSAEATFTQELDWIAELFPILKDRLGQQAKTLSGGEQQMLALARALMQKPRFLCLDEPSIGLAPRLASDLYALLAKVREKDVGILLVEQSARRALEFGTRGYVINLGEIINAGTCAELAQDAYVRGAYLSGGEP